MTISDALNILRPSGNTLDDLLTAFRTFAKTYHPDVNPDGQEMMKLGNLAREILEKSIGTWKVEERQDQDDKSIPLDLADMLAKIRGFQGVEREIRGIYLWVYGNTYPYRKFFKEFGFKWASVKKEWFYGANGTTPTTRKELTAEQQRAKFGSQKINNIGNYAIA
jgi:hypothetical protein